MFNLDSYVLAWSKCQNTFFIEFLSEHIEKNLHCFREKHSSDLLVIGIFATHREAVEMSERLMKNSTNH